MYVHFKDCILKDLHTNTNIKNGHFIIKQYDKEYNVIISDTINIIVSVIANNYSDFEHIEYIYVNNNKKYRCMLKNNINSYNKTSLRLKVFNAIFETNLSEIVDDKKEEIIQPPIVQEELSYSKEHLKQYRVDTLFETDIQANISVQLKSNENISNYKNNDNEVVNIYQNEHTDSISIEEFVETIPTSTKISRSSTINKPTLLTQCVEHKTSKNRFCDSLGKIDKTDETNCNTKRYNWLLGMSPSQRVKYGRWGYK